MEIEKLENILEAILFASGDGISVKDLQEMLELQKSEIKKAVAKLTEKYGNDSGIKLLTYSDKLQFGTNPIYQDSVARVLSPIIERQLSNSALETIAIIAYSQPVTRLEIEQIRGVNCDYTLQVLLKHDLIMAVGRKDAVGKPILFGTTEKFLKRFQLESLEHLPDYGSLLENIKILAEKAVAEPVQKEPSGLYNEFEINHDDNADNPSADQIPDFLKDEPDIEKID